MKSPHHPTVRRYARRGTVIALAATASMPAVIAVSALVDPIGVVQASAPDGAQLWDSTVVHDIAITADAALLADAIATYVDTGERKQVEASVTIDGTTIDQVGMTLGEGGTGFGITAETDPSTVDWVIQLDALVDGQNYQGVTAFDVTAGGVDVLNAAVGLELADAAGLASEEASAGRVSVNAGDAALRLITEDVGAQWQTENFGAEGSLYAAQPGGDWTYRGDDPAAYDGAFVQLSGDDLAPLTTFLDFVNNSDDATFASELPSRLDTDAFATYLAVQDLLRNINDINGPGNNADLFYEPSTGLMTVVTPDLSGAFSARGGQPGGPPGGPDGSLPEGFPQAGQFPGGSLPEGFPQAGQFPGGSLPDGVPQNGGRFQRSNALVDRFLANDTFHQLYESKLTELTATLYTSGTAAGLLDQWVTVLSEQASDVVSPDDVTARAAEVTEQFTAPETTSGSAPTAVTTTTVAG